MADTLSDVILERVFEARDADGAVTTITLRLGRAYHAPDSSSSLKWRCPFQITGIGSGVVREAPGMDSLDALLISLRIAEAFLRSYGDRSITWLGEDWLGLSPPVVETNPDTASGAFEERFEDFFRNFLDDERD